jgi:hypothetical protein
MPVATTRGQCRTLNFSNFIFLSAVCAQRLTGRYQRALRPRFPCRQLPFPEENVVGSPDFHVTSPF